MKRVTRGYKGFANSLLCGLAALAAAGTAHAADGVWLNVAAGNWNDTTKWAGGTVASGVGSVGTFTNATSAMVNQNVAGLTLGGLFFANVNHTVTNGAVTLDNGASPAAVTVGLSHVATEATLTMPLNGTGGLTKRGPGRLNLTAPVPGALDGPLTVAAGTVSATAISGVPFGAGSVLLTGGALEAFPAGSGADVVIEAASGAAGNTFTYGAGNSLLRFSKGTNSSVALTLGNAGAAAESVLLRADYGTLVIAPTNGTSAANLGAAERLFVSGGVATHNGMVSASVVGRNNDARQSGELLAYGANGFERAAYADGLGGGADSIANVTNASATGSAQVYALRVGEGATLAINSGETLTVGDGTRPAGVVLSSSVALSAAVTNGTLAFGTSEGVIHFGEGRNDQLPVRVYSTITGQSGITLSGLTPLSDLELVAAAGNGYSGGTRILSGRVRVPAANRLGPDPVTVRGHAGWGGQLWLTGAITLTNSLRLAGLCGFAEPHSFGTLRLEAGGTVLSGPIELLDDARISVSGGSRTVTVSGPISGTGAFEANAPFVSYTYGTLLLTGANSYSGGTRVNRGELRVGTGGTLGSGPVQNHATLTFASADALEVTNAVTGTGRLTHQGTGTLTLSGARSYAGPLTLDGTLDLDGFSSAYGSLDGTGRVVNAAGPAAVLTVGSANTSTSFSGLIENDITLAKVGSGTLTLYGTHRYSGATVVGGGVLKLGNGVMTEGLSYRLDATDGAKVTLSDSNVTAWATSAGALTFSQTTAALQPVYVTNAINGRAAVRFGSVRNRLATAQSAVAQTVFILNNKLGNTSLAGIWGMNGTDIGIRAGGNTVWNHPGNTGDFSNGTGGQMFINGAAGNTFAAGLPHLVTAVRPTATANTTNAVGDYANLSAGVRSYNGYLGEVLVYNRLLSVPERQSVENHLLRKWLGTGVAPADLLPPTTALVVSNSAAFDLNGVSQTVASLSGGGAVRSSYENACTLTVGGDGASTAYYGGIAGSVSLVKTGSGTLTLFGTNTYSGPTVVSGGVLRLGDWPLASGLAYRLDASDEARVTLESGGSNVTDWAASAGATLSLTQGVANLRPIYVTNAINGRAAVRFGSVRTRLAATQASTAQTVFIVNRTLGYINLAGIWGQSLVDFGIRSASASAWQHLGNANTGDFTFGGQMSINGVAGNTFTVGQPHIVTAVRAAPTNGVTAVGDYWYSGTYSRYYIGDIGEVLVYDRALDAAERQAVEAYLSHKWLGAGVPGRLPATANITLEAGATLDLNGQAQALAGLTGVGAVVGGSVAVSGPIAPGGSGTVGSLSFTHAPVLAGTLLVDVRADGTCDQLVVTGDLDVSQLALVIADTAQLGTAAYTIATCAGDLAGEFTGDNLPEKTWAVRYDRTPGAGRVLLVPQRGTVIGVK